MGVVRSTATLEPSDLEAFSAPLHLAVMSTDKTTDSKPKIDLGLLEEDDEFEEFPAEDWGAADEDAEDVNVWEDNWDDDNIEDDFSQQLRAELNIQPMQQ